MTSAKSDQEKRKDIRMNESLKKMIDHIDDYHGGFIDSNDIVATFDGMISLYDPYLDKKIIPKFQFSEDGRPLKGISDLMNTLLGDYHINDLSRCHFMVSPAFRNDHRTAIEILKNGSQQEYIDLKRVAFFFMK